MTRWALIVGGRGAGKTAMTARVVELLEAGGLTVGGVVQRALEDGGERTGYVACRVGGAESRLLAWKGRPPGGADAPFDFCSFTFDGGAFESARSWVRAASVGADVVVIDEISKLETGGGGHHDAIREALGGRALVLLSVRADELFRVMERFGLAEPVAYLELGGASDLESFVARLSRAVAAAADGS